VTGEELEIMKNNPAKAPLADKELDMLMFILMAVKQSVNVNSEDLLPLRNHGYTDQDIIRVLKQSLKIE
jgi:hypothetical protein